jgi:propanediol utilization protein
MNRNERENVTAYVARLVADTVRELEEDPYGIPVGISAHHVHLTKEAVAILFGRDHVLTF